MMRVGAQIVAATGLQIRSDESLVLQGCDPTSVLESTRYFETMASMASLASLIAISHFSRRVSPGRRSRADRSAERVLDDRDD